jgi:uncharacterized protein YcnI
MAKGHPSIARREERIPMQLTNTFRRLTVAAGIAGLSALTIAAPTSAHVVASPTSTAAGSYSLVTFSFSHGCEGAGTTQIAIQIPEGIETVRPAMHPGWTIERVFDEVEEATPVAGEEGGHGGEHGRVNTVIFTAKEVVPDGFYDAVAIQVRLPEAEVGETLYFPTVQTCESGENAWIQIPAEGESGDELDSPAPKIVLTDATESGH